MSKQLLLVILLVVWFITSIKCAVNDRSFNQYCTSRGGRLTSQTRGSNKADKCVLVLPIYVTDDEEAHYHCQRWNIFVLTLAKMNNDHYAECTYENVYSCRQDYTQIKGMCYKVFDEIQTYEKAQQTCQNDNAQMLMYYEEIGELLNNNMERLSMHFVSESSIGPTNEARLSKEGSGSVYILLLNSAIHYNAPFNSIRRFDEKQTTSVVCQYRPSATSYSFATNIAKLDKWYYPSLANGVDFIWRTSGQYTRADYQYLSHDSKAKELVCERSMKAVAFSAEGTQADTSKHLTQIMPVDVKQSFVTAYGPFEYCQGWNGQGIFHYVRTKKNLDVHYCQNNSPLDYSKYNGEFRQWSNHAKFVYTYLYVPQITNGYQIFNRRDSYHAPMLCTIDITQAYHPCEDWFFSNTTGGLACLQVFPIEATFEEAKRTCQATYPPSEIAVWTNKKQFDNFQYWLQWNRYVWVGCSNKNDCSSSNLGSALLGLSNLNTNEPATNKHNVMCMRPPRNA